MASPDRHDEILDAPDPKKLKNPSWVVKHLHGIWKRTGGYQSAVYNLTGLEASVKELNTLVGINTGLTVQQQLNKKQDIPNPTNVDRL